MNQKLREIMVTWLEDKYGEDHGENHPRIDAEIGFKKAVETLQSMAPEFDKSATKDQAKHEDSDGYFGFLSGAEWQFTELKALLAARDLRVSELETALIQISSAQCPTYVAHPQSVWFAEHVQSLATKALISR